MDAGHDSGGAVGESLATSRSRRTRSDKHGRLAALDRLRSLKGTKNKYEVSEVKNVYDEVDEREYAKIQQDRLEDDWIMDDDGSGYVEDGREVFDEDGTDNDIFLGKKDKHRGSKRQKLNSGAQASAPRPHSQGSIKNMLINMPVRKRSVETQIVLTDDDLLKDILQDVNKESSSVLKPQPTHLKKKINSFSPQPRKEAVNPFCKPKEPTTPVRANKIKYPLKPRNISSEKSVNGVSTQVKRGSEVLDEPASQRVEEVADVGDDDPMENMDSLIFDDDMDEPEPDKPVKEKKEEGKSEVNGVSTEKHQEVQSEEERSNTPAEVNRGYKAVPKVDSTKLTSGWDTVKKGPGETARVQDQDVQIDSQQLPMTTNSSGEQVLRFYWLDAYEDMFKQPGTVYLFGKVWVDSAKTHVSACVTVKNVERRVFVLPRKKKINLKSRQEIGDVTMMDVYEEFNTVTASNYKILEFKSRAVKKKYAFDNVGVPEESEYLEVRYPAQYAALPKNVEGQTFSHVFGTHTSALELFLLQRRIKGPSWMDIKLPRLPQQPVSWCRIEAVVNSPEQVTAVSGVASPPVVVVTLGTRTTVNPKTHQEEVAMVSCLVHYKFPLDKAPPQPPFQSHFCVVTHPSDVPWPWDLKAALAQNPTGTKVEKQDTERALLGFLLAKIHKIDPDIVVGHDFMGYSLPVLLHRVQCNKIPHWSRLGRLRRAQMPKQSSRGFAERTAMCGRLVCDIKTSAKELIRAKSYDLPALVSQVLHLPEEQCRALSLDDVKKMYESSSSLLQLVSLTMQDTLYTLRLMCELNILPLAVQITNIAGNVMSRTLLGGRSERNEYLLLHAFTEKDYIVPNKEYGKDNQKAGDQGQEAEDEEGGQQKKGRRKPAYTGGLVLDPKKGFYDKYILLMDFNSLYPSIIQEYNICFTTVPWKQSEGDEGSIPQLPDRDQEPGILPTEIRKLVESRRQVKQLMKAPDLSPDLKLQYDIRQKALKLTANSMYGCLGFSFSRFFARHLASLVTAKGRDILLHTRDLVEKMGLEVIYGDTDSIMINTNSTDYDQVFKLGNKIKAEVNKLYKLLELEVDGVFKYMLLLKKKKYAALTVTRLPSGQVIEEQELKGLDMVRRDWSQLACDCGKYIVSQILSEQGPDERVDNIHLHLRKVKADLEGGKIALEALTITKMLTKHPRDYPDKKSLPHVQVAMRINSGGGKTLQRGDTVAYVICEDGSNLPASQRAYHVEELQAKPSLVIDKNYYLANQVHPVVSRLCDPIEGTDAARIADSLGLDPASYQASKQYSHADEEEAALATKSEEEKYRLCQRFSFTCPAPDCATVITMDGVFRGVGSGSNLEVALESCPNPKCRFPIYSQVQLLANRLRLDIRSHIQKYYSSWMVCEDPACNHRTRRLPFFFSKGFPVCNSCCRGVMLREYNDSQLFMQLCFYDHIFDYKKACQKNKDERILDEQLRKAYHVLQAVVKKTLKMSAYSQVILEKLFAKLFP